ncbi:RraA family protein [Streptomyces phaeolivaceus]|uniref:RraA family protein n=1 Tax=Streptomyces phaeolivaceus TaxID=2653200 RepID=UPI001D042C54|nr:RraA family protein [Streptomyces phaeolivaceus]
MVVRRDAPGQPHPGVGGEGPAGAHIATTAVERADDRSVIVVDNQGRTDVSCWGGILSLGAARRGVRGVVADGVCRDVEEAREPAFPVFARGSVPATARGRPQQRSTGEPVTVAGLTVEQLREGRSTLDLYDFTSPGR